MLSVTKSTNPPPDAATHYGNASFLRRLVAASLSDAGGNLMIFLGLAVLAVFTTGASNADESDQALPDVISNAKTTVEVLMRHAISTGECFPDPNAKARFENGRVVLEDFKRYINMEPRLSEGLVAFQLDGKWGACDKDGKVVIAAKYQSGLEFHEGMAGADEGGKLGFIDKEGKWLIQPRVVRNIIVDSQADGDNADPSPKIARLVASGLDLRATDEDGNTPLLAVADSYLPIAKARYVWSKETGNYVGPTGGMDLPFLRLKTDDPSDSLEFGEYVKKQKDRKKLDEAAPEK